MQNSAPSDPAIPTQEEPDPANRAARVRYRFEPSVRTSPDRLETSNVATASGTGQPLQSSPQRRGSSRESDMYPRSPTPAEAGAIKYTRTGRVSKATKGQRIHRCEECGKTYTRAEHLRRHQQNHNPGAHQCDVPGCGRSFYREDLLTRHKARHNDPQNPPSRRASIGSQTSTSGGAQPQLSLQHPVDTEHHVEVVKDDPQQSVPATTGQQSASSRAPPRKDYIPLREMSRSSQGTLSIDTGASHPTEVFDGLGNISSRCAYMGYESPLNEYVYDEGQLMYGQPQQPCAQIGTNISHYGPHKTSRSPVSAGSSSGFIPPWGLDVQSPALHPFSSSSSSESTSDAGVYNTFGDPRYIAESTAKERDSMESAQLLTPIVIPSTDHELGVSTTPNEYRYLDAYWTWIHPLWPVVHRPTFNFDHASPLLRAAMLTLGGHVLQDYTDMNNARVLHERCLKVIKRRTITDTHTYRVCDMQAIVLTELYSMFKSRRPPLHLSRHFVEVYGGLANDPQTLALATVMSLQASPSHMWRIQPSNYTGELDIDAQCRSRLFLACHVLDQQHSMLFGRQRTTCTTTLAADLAFPQSQAYWDAPYGGEVEISHQRAEMSAPCYDYVYQALCATADMTQRGESLHDAFQSSLMMTCLANPPDGIAAFDFSADHSPVLHTLEQSPRTRLAYHTFMLCKHTPIRDLLAVAGESWCMAEKLGSQHDYTGAQIVARDWAGFSERTLDYGAGAEDDRSSIKQAIHHALQIMHIHRDPPKTGLLYQEWSLYLTAIVIWARAYMNSEQLGRKPRLSVPSPIEPILSPSEKEQIMIALIDSGASTLTWREAQVVLLWVKGRIEMTDMPHNCGLTNGALDVLGKLAARGNEDGWFSL